MNANEMMTAIAEQVAELFPALEIEIIERRRIVQVYGLHKVAQGVEAIDGVRNQLTALGFNMGPNSGIMRIPADEPEKTLRELYEAMTPEQQKAADEAWIAMGGYIG